MTTHRILYDLAEFKNGRAFKSTEIRPQGGIPIVKIAEMNRGITSATGWFDGPVDAKHRIAKGDLLFSWSGTIVVQTWQGPDAALNQHIFKVSARADADQTFLKYLLQSLVPKFDGLVMDQKTTMGHVKVADLKSMIVDLPDMTDQLGIANALSSLDNKIESNDNLIRLIPALIRARVDAALDQSSIPVNVADLARFINGGAYTKAATGTGRMVLRIAELNGGPGKSTVYNDIQVPEDKTARSGDLLMSWSGSLGIYRWTRDEAIINQHIFKVIPRAYPAWLVHDRLHYIMPVFQGIAKDKATTMGHIQRGHLETTQVLVPDTSLIETLDVEVSGLWRRMLNAERENLDLIHLRETLMPELLSGRLPASLEHRTLEGIGV
ncbi:restriction endonuclease subunit S [Arthrobacter sp. Bz4]|uniref:restriction endonuclease subunit S n=1 Tax=Arthrobacter sp. Bz4 TaxID=2171979 RepID=UPI000D521BA2|nr:restriction endonuclease subunit S [Arthrobacter sp. Bz4]PVE17447.1 hypothetical protein DDA93_10685 [Arthrobacter sp. Bz4]